MTNYFDIRFNLVILNQIRYWFLTWKKEKYQHEIRIKKAEQNKILAFKVSPWDLIDKKSLKEVKNPSGQERPKMQSKHEVQKNLLHMTIVTKTGQKKPKKAKNS